MFVATSFVLLTVATSLINAQVPFLKACPTQSVMKPFDVTKYLGLWYEYEKYFAIFQVGGKCVTANYTDAGNGVVGVYNRQVNILTNQPKTIAGTAVFTGDTTEAKLAVTFPSAGNMAGKYWVLDTDYTSYSIVWSCTTNPFGLSNIQFMWVLTRDKIPSAQLITNVENIIKQRGLSTAALMKTPQTC